MCDELCAEENSGKVDLSCSIPQTYIVLDDGVLEDGSVLVFTTREELNIPDEESNKYIAHLQRVIGCFRWFSTSGLKQRE